MDMKLPSNGEVAPLDIANVLFRAPKDCAAFVLNSLSKKVSPFRVY
jgi:hypothetical protein